MSPERVVTHNAEIDARRFPPIWHDDGTLTLWHPDSPGTRLRVRPGILRRIGWRRSAFATLGEACRYYRQRRVIPPEASTSW